MADRAPSTPLPVIVLAVVGAGAVPAGSAALVVRLASGRAGDDPPSNRPAPNILMVGDSVSAMARTELNNVVGTHASLTVAGYPGFTTTLLLPIATKLVEDRKVSGPPLDRGVFLMGYNDVLDHVDRSVDLEAMVDLANQFPCSLWLTLPDGHASADHRLGSAEVASWNARARAAVATRRHVHL